MTRRLRSFVDRAAGLSRALVGCAALLIAGCERTAEAAVCLDALAAGVPGADFGYALATGGDRIAVSAPMSNRVYLFGYATGNWRLERILAHPEPVPAVDVAGNGFGHALGLAGDWLVVGDYVRIADSRPRRPPGSDGSIVRSGVYLYDLRRTGAAPRRLFGTSRAGQLIGSTVAISAGYVAATVQLPDPRRPWTNYVAVAPLTRPDRVGRIDAPAPVNASDYGTKIALDGNLLLASAGRVGRAGAAWLTNLATGENRRVPDDDSAAATQFVNDVAIADAVAVVGGAVSWVRQNTLVLRLDRQGAGAIRQVEAMGPVAATRGLAAIAPAPAQIPGEARPETANLPSLILVDSAGAERKAMLKDPASGRTLREASALALSDRHLVIARAPRAGCKVVTQLIGSLR